MSPPGLASAAARRDESAQVGDVLDHFQRRHDVEARALGGEVLDQSGAIGEPRAGRLGVGARHGDRFSAPDRAR